MPHRDESAKSRHAWLRPPLRRTALGITFLALSLFSLSRLSSAQSINDQHVARVAPIPAAKVDINRATVPQLMHVHGITQSYAQRIVSGRPYSNKGQLKTNGILPPQVYEAAKDLLIAHHIK